MRARILAGVALAAASFGLTQSTAGAQAVQPAPTISVGVTATPTSRPAPGGSFTLNISITNTSQESLTVASLDDTVLGDLDNYGTCTTQQTILAGSTYTCAATGTFLGAAGDTRTHTVDAVALDSDGNQARAQDTVTIAITAPAPTTTTTTTAPVTSTTVFNGLLLGVTNTPEPSVSPTTSTVFNFTVVASNLSNRPVTITSVTDDVYGNVGGSGDCARLIGARLAPRGSVSCVFQGTFSSIDGASQRNVATVTARDDSGLGVAGSDDAVIGISVPTTTTTKAPATTTTTSAGIPVTGSGTSRTAAIGIAVGSFGLLFIGLADEQRRRIISRLRHSHH
jgi:hypothetical protein